MALDSGTQTANSNNIFAGLSEPADLTKYALYHGVTDWTQLAQFNQFEGGYGFLIVLSIPTFLEKLKTQNNEYKKLIDSYTHYIQYAFKGISGFGDIDSETGTLNNGNSELKLINKVNGNASMEISMRYNEQKGRLISKVHELYLRGVKDPDTGVKTHLGLVGANGGTSGDYEEEVFNFLFFNTDNTVRKIEHAALLVNAQITKSTISDIANFERGNYEWKEVDVAYNCICLRSAGITKKAQQYLDVINNNTVWDQMKFGYEQVTNSASANGAWVGGKPQLATTSDNQQRTNFGTNTNITAGATGGVYV